jgi:hypothetical protein
MSDTPKFEVIDRRRAKAAEEEQENQRHPESPSEPTPSPEPTGEPHPGPRLVVSEPRVEAEPTGAEQHPELPAAPTAIESHAQKAAYDASAQRLEEIIRAQNPGMGAPPAVTFESLVQQFYVSAMIQMGAGTPEGQRPRVDILGARTTIDLLGILAEKTRGNLNEAETRALDTVLFDVRTAFMELTSMISVQAMQPPPPMPKR